MSETAVKKEKKKWSTGKKVAVILCSVLLALILIVVSGGLIYLHNYCQVKDYTVTAMGNHDVTLIAHRGFRAVAPENTLPAFEEAGKAGFTGAECDTYRTKDGVWVISHDSHTYRTLDQAGAMALKCKIWQFAASPLFNDNQGYAGGASEAEQQHP